MSYEKFSLGDLLLTIETVANETTFNDLVASHIASSNEGRVCDPFYLTDVGRIFTLWDTWRKYLPSVQPFYACKCNTDRVLLSTLATLGCGFDCAGQAEIENALALGVPAERIVYHNPFKQVSHLVYAAKNNVSQMVFDTEGELHKIKANFSSGRLIIRIACDDSSARYGKMGSKFGCSLNEAEKLLKTAKDIGLSVIGVCFHIGSGAQNPQVYLRALAISHQVFEIGQSLGYNFTLLDIGGGLSGDAESYDIFVRQCEAIESGLQQFFSGRPDLKVIAEPGRYFASSPFTLVVCVIGKRILSKSPPSFM